MRYVSMTPALVAALSQPARAGAAAFHLISSPPCGRSASLLCSHSHSLDRPVWRRPWPAQQTHPTGRGGWAPGSDRARPDGDRRRSVTLPGDCPPCRPCGVRHPVCGPACHQVPSFHRALAGCCLRSCHLSRCVPRRRSSPRRVLSWPARDGETAGRRGRRCYLSLSRVARVSAFAELLSPFHAAYAFCAVTLCPSILCLASAGCAAGAGWPCARADVAADASTGLKLHRLLLSASRRARGAAWAPASVLMPCLLFLRLDLCLPTPVRTDASGRSSGGRLRGALAWRPH